MINKEINLLIGQDKTSRQVKRLIQLGILLYNKSVEKLTLKKNFFYLLINIFLKEKNILLCILSILNFIMKNLVLIVKVLKSLLKNINKGFKIWTI